MATGDKNTSLGIDENVEGLLAYLFGWISGIALLLLEKDNKFVRFHAMQSIAVFAGLTVLDIIFTFIPGLWFLTWILGIVAFVLWIYLMIKAYQGERYKLPYVGEWAEKQVG